MHFLGGTTLHTGLGFKFGKQYLPLAPEKREQLRKYLEDIEVIIIDEMSMVSADQFYDVHKRLQQIFVSVDLFGGKALMLVGDLLQLPPVRAATIFSKPRNFKNSSLWSSSDNLWSNCEVVVLKINHRQGDGNPWTECLNRLRIAEPTDSDISLLESRQLKLSDVQYQKAVHVFATNYEVNNHNTKMLNNLSTSLFKIHAVVSLSLIHI